MPHAPNSPDLKTEEMWQRVYQIKFHNAKELNQRMLALWLEAKRHR